MSWNNCSVIWVWMILPKGLCLGQITVWSLFAHWWLPPHFDLPYVTDRSCEVSSGLWIFLSQGSDRWLNCSLGYCLEWACVGLLLCGLLLCLYLEKIFVFLRNIGRLNARTLLEENREWIWPSMSKSHIWDSIMAIRVAKHGYFSALVMSADSHPTSLFKVTCFLLGKDEPLNYLEGGVRNWYLACKLV